MASSGDWRAALDAQISCHKAAHEKNLIYVVIRIARSGMEPVCSHALTKLRGLSSFFMTHFMHLWLTNNSKEILADDFLQYFHSEYEKMHLGSNFGFWNVDCRKLLTTYVSTEIPEHEFAIRAERLYLPAFM